MAISKSKKNEILQELQQSFKEAKSVMFSKYSGISVSGFSKVRTALREQNVECRVAKKTLIKLAAKELGVDELPAESLDGPIAVIFSYDDELSGAKLIDKMSKDFEQLELTGGIDKFLGMQLRALNSNSISNEVIITLRGYTSFY